MHRPLSGLLAAFTLSFLASSPAGSAPFPGLDALTESTAAGWAAEADGDTAAVYDDDVEVAVGSASIRFETGGGFDTRLRYPATMDAAWDLTTATAFVFRALVVNDETFQSQSPWIRLCTTAEDYVELRGDGDPLNLAIGQWTRYQVPLTGNATWVLEIVGNPSLAEINYLEIHADTWDYGFILWLDGLAFLSDPAPGWPMKHRDMAHTGRAAYAVPDVRENGSFFDIFLWQKPSPDSPVGGGFGGTSMTFLDGGDPFEWDVVAGTYHWPKGVQGMDRQTGRLLWAGNPAGGESIGQTAPAFSADGRTIYVINDATESPEYPDGHPFMAFSAATGPAAFRHNGDDFFPGHLSMPSPTPAPDGRIFLHGWVDRPYAGTDFGTRLAESWAAATVADCGLSSPTLYAAEDRLQVLIGARYGAVVAYDGETGQELWTVATPTIDATITVDPETGNCYVGAGSDDVWVVGLDRDGIPLWGDAALPVYDHEPGVSEPHRAQSAGCLSHDGATYYFQTVSMAGDGRLFAVNTADGSVKWEFATGSAGWEGIASSPIVTEDGIVIVGSNEGDAYYAVRDDGVQGTGIDVLVVESEGNARATATLSADGRLYLPLRVPWTTGNGDGDVPTFATANVYSAVDLTTGYTVYVEPPADQRAWALNGAVELHWTPTVDPLGCFDHYAVYRDTAPFFSVVGRTPLLVETDLQATGVLDDSAVNGVSYWYAVTTVSTTGAERTTVTPVGPRTPRDETDLQAVCIARTPRFPRYDPTYTLHEVTEPSGFGPYLFTAATGLGSGQTGATQRWPLPGDPVTWTATIRNRGTNPFVGSVTAIWSVDGSDIETRVLTVDLDPGETAASSIQTTWDDALHDVGFRFETSPGAESRPGNNALECGTKSVAFLSYIDRTRMEAFREETPGYPGALTDDFIDWLNRHMVRLNSMFEAAGTGKQVHFDVLEVLDDTEPDPGIDRLPFAIFPFRYYDQEGSLRLSGYYDPVEDLDFGLHHEMAHQLGLIDLYQMNLGADRNEVTGEAYQTIPCLMNGVSHFVSSHSAHGMESWLHKAHGYYGQYLYNLPQTITLRFLGLDGAPLAGAAVTVYQMVDRPGRGAVLTPQVKARGTTDPNGDFLLPNVPIDSLLVPTTWAGDRLRDNPFGYVAVVGTNGVMLLQVEHRGFTDRAWLDITEANEAWWGGQTGNAIIPKHLALGGPIETIPPHDLAERNAASWGAWAEGGTASATDDLVRRVAGYGSVRFETDGGFDNVLRYPNTHLARWNLSGVDSLQIWFYAENPNFSFQNWSPWIRLVSSSSYVELHATSEFLNQANGQWVRAAIPLAGNAEWARTEFGAPDLAAVNRLDIHADTWDSGFRLWVDGVRFSPFPAVGVSGDGDRPTATALVAAGPNPFAGGTVFRVDLADRAPVRLEVFDARGRLVRRLVDGPLDAGRHPVTWNGRDDAGRAVTAGVYFVRLRSGDARFTAKVILVEGAR